MASIVTHLGSGAFGLYELKCSEMSKGLGNKDANMSFMTLANIIGWIPVVGAIIGAISTYGGVSIYKDTSDADDRAIAKGFIARGIAEILCLGPLLMIIDIVVTIARQCIQKTENS